MLPRHGSVFLSEVVATRSPQMQPAKRSEGACRCAPALTSSCSAAKTIPSPAVTFPRFASICVIGLSGSRSRESSTLVLSAYDQFRAQYKPFKDRMRPTASGRSRPSAYLGKGLAGARGDFRPKRTTAASKRKTEKHSEAVNLGRSDRRDPNDFIRELRLGDMNRQARRQADGLMMHASPPSRSGICAGLRSHRSTRRFASTATWSASPAYLPAT